MSLRKGWNFHNDIALKLEGICRSYLKFQGRPMGTIFDADSIETSCFVEVMVYLLRKMTKCSVDNPDVEQFIKNCAPHFCKSGHEIEPVMAEKLISEFSRLFGQLTE